MVIADRLRALRKKKGLTQEDIAKRTGVLAPYISRIENGHIVPSIETLGKIAHALEVPLYLLFYEGEQAPVLLQMPGATDVAWGGSGKDARLLAQFRQILEQIGPDDRALLLRTASKIANGKSRNMHRAAR